MAQEKRYRILRSQSLFGLFDWSNNLIWSGVGVVSGLGPQLAKLLDFQLTLQNRVGEQVTPPPAFCFLPFYAVQQDQDPDNAARIIRFILSNVPKDMQLILGTVSLHGVQYSGHEVRTTDKLRLLNEESYEETKDYINPLYIKLLQTSNSAS